MSFAPTTLLLRAANSTLLQSSVRTFAIPATAGKNHYKVLIAGGGTGGCAVAGRLRKSIKPGDLAVIEPTDVSYSYLPITVATLGCWQFTQLLFKNAAERSIFTTSWSNRQHMFDGKGYFS